MSGFLLIFFCMVASSLQLSAWVFNADATGADVLSHATDLDKVLPTSNFTVSAFDSEKQIMYLGDSVGTAKTNHSIVRATFVGDSVQIKALGNVSNHPAVGFTGATLNNKFIKKLEVLPGGDLLVHAWSAATTDADGQIYIIKNPWSDTTIKLIQLAARVKDNTAPAGADSTFLNIAFAGKRSATEYRIVGVVPENGQYDLGTGGTSADQRMRTYIYNSANGTITEDVALIKTIQLNAASDLQAVVDSCAAGADNLTGFHWNDELKALYFGVTITGVKDTAVNNHCFMVMAKFGEDDPTPVPGTLTFAPFLPTGDDENILSLGQVGQNANCGINIKKVQTLKTRDGKRYLVVQLRYNNGDAVQTTRNSRGVYCFPIADDSTVAFADRGKGAKVDSGTGEITRNAIATNAEETYANKTSRRPATGELSEATECAEDVRSLVGGQPLAAAFNNILDMKVVGDSVLVVCGGAIANTAIGTAAHGAWMSSPIYDVLGEIMGWTPWVKVFASGANDVQTLGNLNNIYVDNFGTAYFVAGNELATVVNQVGFQKWNSINSQYSNTSNAFISALASDFGPNNPVWFTKEFLSQPLEDSFGADGAKLAGITIFGARNKVALISSAKYQAAPFGSVSASTAASYKAFSLPVGNVLCAEMTRINSAVAGLIQNGFIFVGGEKGLFVLRQDNGNGFNISNAAETLANLNTAFPAAYSFKSVPGIEGPVYRMVATPNFLVVMTAKKLYRIRMDGLIEPFGQAYGAASTMFADGNAPEFVDATANLDIPLAQIATRRARGVLLIQTVLEAGANETFCDLVNIENTEATLLGSNTLGKGMIRGINVDTKVVANLTNFPSVSLSYPLRKMFIRHLNHQNTVLHDGVGSFISNLNDGLYGTTPFNVIANLIVVGGDVISKQSSLNWFVVKGAHYIDADYINTGGTSYEAGQRGILSTQPDATHVEYFLKPLGNQTGGLRLINDADFVGLPAVFGNKFDESPVISRILDNGSVGTWLNSTANSGYYSFCHARLENGQLMIFGYPFGASVFE